MIRFIAIGLAILPALLLYVVISYAVSRLPGRRMSERAIMLRISRHVRRLN